VTPARGKVAARLAAALLGSMAMTVVACDLAYPEVVVVNRTAETILIKDPSFNGCRWNVVLAYGEATAPGRCLPGSDRVHFQKLDAADYCRDQVADGTIPGLCACDGGVGPPDGGVDPGLVNPTPLWFNYQTATTRRVGYGDYQVVEITMDDWEQDFSIPGPYGH
jgi:hypothetical protein